MIKHYDGEIGAFGYDDEVFEIETVKNWRGTYDCIRFIGKIPEDGDLSSLEIPEGLTSCRELFKRQENLRIAPAIPEGVVDCSEIFIDCIHLEKVPKIPNNILNCNAMFKGCGALKEVPNIPESAMFCREMFHNCRTLKKAPVISKGVKDCEFMFCKCTSLKEAPVIPDSVENCRHMFHRCSSLEKASTIPEGVEDCTSMFEGCGLLKEAPAIPNNVQSCNDMFKNCVSLKVAPVIPSSVGNCNRIFEGCTSLERIAEIPEDIELGHLYEYPASVKSTIPEESVKSSGVSNLETMSLDVFDDDILFDANGLFGPNAPLNGNTKSEKPRHQTGIRFRSNVLFGECGDSCSLISTAAFPNPEFPLFDALKKSYEGGKMHEPKHPLFFDTSSLDEILAGVKESGLFEGDDSYSWTGVLIVNADKLTVDDIKELCKKSYLTMFISQNEWDCNELASCTCYYLEDNGVGAPYDFTEIGGYEDQVDINGYEIEFARKGLSYKPGVIIDCWPVRGRMLSMCSILSSVRYPECNMYQFILSLYNEGSMKFPKSPVFIDTADITEVPGAMVAGGEDAEFLINADKLEQADLAKIVAYSLKHDLPTVLCSSSIAKPLKGCPLYGIMYTGDESDDPFGDDFEWVENVDIVKEGTSIDHGIEQKGKSVYKSLRQVLASRGVL